MIFFLYGKNDFFSSRKLKAIIAGYQQKHITGLNLRYFDFNQDNFESLRDESQIKSMFKEKKMFILKNGFSNSVFKQKFLENKEKFIKSNNLLVFYEKQEIKERDGFFFFLKKNARCQEFKPLKPKDLETFAKKEFSKYKKNIDFMALNLLIKSTGNDLWQLFNEIQKLSVFKGAETSKISVNDVKLLVSAKQESNIFKTIEMIASGQKDKAILLLHQHLEKGDSPFYLLSMIAFQFRKLLIAKEKVINNQSFKNLKWHPFVIKKTKTLSEKFSFEQLKKIYRQISQIDLDTKTGKISPELGLDLLVAYS